MPAIMCPCGPTIERRTHIVKECEIYKVEGKLLTGGMRKMDVCDIEKFCRLQSSEESIAIHTEKSWPQTSKHDEHRMNKQSMCSLQNNRNERPCFGGAAV